MPGGRRKYPEIDAPVWAALCEGFGPAEVLRRVRSGELDGLEDPCPIPERTYYDRLAILRRENGHERGQAPPVQPGGEERAIDTILRRAIGIADREVKRLEDLEKTNRHGLNPNQSLTLKRLMETLQGYRTRAAAARRQERGSSSPNPSTRATAASTNNKAPGPLDAVREALQAADRAVVAEQEGALQKGSEPVQSGKARPDLERDGQAIGAGGSAGVARGDGGTEASGDGTSLSSARPSMAEPRPAQAWPDPPT